MCKLLRCDAFSKYLKLLRKYLLRREWEEYLGDLEGVKPRNVKI